MYGMYNINVCFCPVSQFRVMFWMNLGPLQLADCLQEILWLAHTEMCS
jgi:hypothetical protein